MACVLERCEPVVVDKQTYRFVPASHHRRGLCTSHDEPTALSGPLYPFCTGHNDHEVTFKGGGWVHGVFCPPANTSTAFTTRVTAYMHDHHNTEIHRTS